MAAFTDAQRANVRCRVEAALALHASGPAETDIDALIGQLRPIGQLYGQEGLTYASEYVTRRIQEVRP